MEEINIHLLQNDNELQPQLLIMDRKKNPKIYPVTTRHATNAIDPSHHPEDIVRFDMLISRELGAVMESRQQNIA